jgi:hypothetical protein
MRQTDLEPGFLQVFRLFVVTRIVFWVVIGPIMVVVMAQQTDLTQHCPYPGRGVAVADPPPVAPGTSTPWTPFCAADSSDRYGAIARGQLLVAVGEPAADSVRDLLFCHAGAHRLAIQLSPHTRLRLGAHIIPSLVCLPAG